MREPVVAFPRGDGNPVDTGAGLYQLPGGCPITAFYVSNTELNGAFGPGSEYNAAVMKLVQKQFLRGSREFEIVDDAVNVRLRSPLKEETLSVMLAVLNPEPVVNGSFLDFHSRVKCGPLLSLLLDKPNPREFNAFVEELKRRAREEYSSFAGLKTGSMPEGMAANVFEEPPDFEDPGQKPPKRSGKAIRVADIEVSIEMLRQYLEGDDIEPLLAALEALKSEPDAETGMARLVQAFDALGPRQGAVLTYAPYIGILLSDDPFGY